MNIKLRLLNTNDIEPMLEWMHDSAVNSNFRFDFASMTENEVKEFINNSFTKESKNFAIANKKDEYLGTISLKHISEKDKSAEYAIVTRTKAWGTGAAYIATIKLLKYAFMDLKLHRVYLNVLENNKRTNAFYKKCGFVYKEKTENCLFLRGEYHSLNWYEITKEQWLINIIRNVLQTQLSEKAHDFNRRMKAYCWYCA